MSVYGPVTFVAVCNVAPLGNSRTRALLSRIVFIIESGTIDSFRTTVSGTNYNGNYIVDTNNSGTLTAAAPQ